MCVLVAGAMHNVMRAPVDINRHWTHERHVGRVSVRGVPGSFPLELLAKTDDLLFTDGL